MGVRTVTADLPYFRPQSWCPPIMAERKAAAERAAAAERDAAAEREAAADLLAAALREADSSS